MEELKNRPIFGVAVDDHFKEMGFKVSTMDPRQLLPKEQGEVTRGVPALHLVSTAPDGTISRIFINRNEAYVERESGWFALSARRHAFDKRHSISIEEITQALDKLKR